MICIFIYSNITPIFRLVSQDTRLGRHCAFSAEMAISHPCRNGAETAGDDLQRRAAPRRRNRTCVGRAWNAVCGLPLDGWPDSDVADLDIARLVDGEGDSAGDGHRRD